MWYQSPIAMNPGTFIERIGWAARSAKQLRTRFLTPSEIGEQETTRWRDLARRSCHFNPFILPDFLQATWAHFGDAQSQRLCVVDNPADGRWLAAGSFSRVEATHSYP